MLVEKRLKALAADLDLDHVVAAGHDLGLAAKSRGAAHVERFVEDVELLVFDLGELVETLGHVDVAGRASTDAAAAVALGRARPFGRGQDRAAALDCNLQLLACESNDRHSVWLRSEMCFDAARRFGL